MGIQTLNEGFDDWNILRDGSLCYPLMILLKNPLDREINLRLEFTESSGYRREGDRPIKYLADFMIPANAEVSRLRGIPLAMLATLSANDRHAGILRNNGYMIRGKLLSENVQSDFDTYLQFDLDNYWAGSGFTRSEVRKNAKGNRVLLICPTTLANRKTIGDIVDRYNVNKSWPVESLPQSCRPLLALNKLVLFGVTPADLSKGQRDAVMAAIESGLEVHLFPSPAGQGDEWGKEFMDMERAGSDLDHRILQASNGRGQDGEGNAARNLVKQGIRILDSELRPGNPSNLALVLLAGYVVLLIPGLFFSLRAKRKQIALLWMIPTIFLASVVTVTIIGVSHYGVTKETKKIVGLYHLANEARELQIIEGVFDPLGSKSVRTIPVNEQLVMDYSSVINYKSVVYSEGEDGVLTESIESFPRSLYFTVRSVSLGDSSMLKIPLVRWAVDSQRIDSGLLSDMVEDLADAEVMDRLALENGIRVIGMEGRK
ncbi:MAG: hypothetical protein CBC13_04005 [Planctomycetia bacterium TMED53]|nr:MAG: hypothetical protein CBC13_04005 [Planctomycetia bacterium TMED53]